MEHIKLKEGGNVIHTEGGIKLMAQVKGGQVTGYTATNKNGKALKTQTSPYEKKGGGTSDSGYCTVCISTSPYSQICYIGPCAVVRAK